MGAAVPDILAIVSKAIFEKDARVGGKVASPGDVWPVDRYTSSNKALQPLSAGGRIFLVTVRPPDEQLWLVGVVDAPRFDGAAWVSATPNALPVTNVSPLRKTIAFESGKGMSQDKGALGMSLQTPRALTPPDVAQLLGAAGSGAPAAPAAKAPVAAPTGPAALLAALAASPKDEALREATARELLALGAAMEAREALSGLAHLDAHDETGLPCLCKQCWAASADKCELAGVVFQRDLVVKSGRVLFYWAPVELDDKRPALRNSVRASLSRRLAALLKNRKRQPRPEF
jgi:hypothetical protein